MTIKHFKGRFNNRLFTDLLLFAECTFYRLLYLLNLKLTVWTFTEYDERFVYSMGAGNENQHDWRKVFGSKSGVKTITNNEEIVVNRFTPAQPNHHGILGYVETALYHRSPNAGFHVSNVQKSTLFKGGRIQHKTPVQLQFALPVTPWAGGNEKPHTNYQYKMWNK